MKKGRNVTGRASDKGDMEHRTTPCPDSSPKKKTRRSAAAEPAIVRAGPDTSRDPRETPIAKRDLAATLERFLVTIEHPIERAIAPHAIQALVAFAAIERKPGRAITFGWIDPERVLAATPVDEEHPAGLAACYFAVLAAFYRFRAAEGALDREAADRIAATYVQAAMSFAKIDESTDELGRS